MVIQSACTRSESSSSDGPRSPIRLTEEEEEEAEEEEKRPD